MGLLDGKVAVITGAGGGIGRAYAQLFASEGAQVVVNDLGGLRSGEGKNASFADQAVSEIVDAGGKAAANYDSVATREGVESLLWTAERKFGGIDILVNNAGILRDRMMVNMSEAEYDAVMSVHARGSFLASQVAARAMIRQGRGGVIVNTTSISGMIGMVGQTNYSMAKAAIAGLTFTAAMELSRYNIRVNAIAPIALTRMTEDLPTREGSERLGPEYIAPAALFLASPLSEGVTGKILGVHGKHIFEYGVVTSDGVHNDSDGPWTAADIKASWSSIVR